MGGAGFLEAATVTPAAQALFDEDVAEDGYVMNASRVWAYNPAIVEGLFGLMSKTLAEQGLSFRDRGILVTACASTLGDSYCSLAWGSKLAKVSDPAVAASVLSGSDAELTDKERAMARWARQVTGDPNATTQTDVELLRDAGFTDPQIFAITTFVALRLAFSTVNDALGAQPDAELFAATPRAVADAVAYGRPSAASSM